MADVDDFYLAPAAPGYFRGSHYGEADPTRGLGRTPPVSGFDSGQGDAGVYKEVSFFFVEPVDEAMDVLRARRKELRLTVMQAEGIPNKQRYQMAGLTG